MKILHQIENAKSRKLAFLVHARLDKNDNEIVSVFLINRKRISSKIRKAFEDKIHEVNPKAVAEFIFCKE